MWAWALALVMTVVACKGGAPRDETASVAGSDSASAPIASERVTYGPGLQGYLYRPAGTGPFPAIVFNHGSEPDPGEKANQARFYVKHGFVLFVPHRRGQGLSAGSGIDGLDSSTSELVDALVAQTDDVMTAVAFVAGLPEVDPRRIATAGCSLGGIEALFAAERGTGLVAAIDFAGASITWARNVVLRERMTLAARNAKVPVLFLQAENDYDTTPSTELAEVMRGAGKPSRARIFPPWGTTPRQGHGFCAGGDAPPWADEVLAFLADAMR